MHSKDLIWAAFHQLIFLLSVFTSTFSIFRAHAREILHPPDVSELASGKIKLLMYQRFLEHVGFAF